MITQPDTSQAHHRHSVGVYTSEEFWAVSVAAFLAPTLARGGGVVAVVTAAHRPMLDRALLRAGIDVTEVRASGRYAVSDVDELLSDLLVDGVIDPERFRVTAESVLARARRHGDAFRAYGELAPTLLARGDAPNALHMERLWNGILDQHAFPLLCLYSADHFDGLDRTAAFLDLCEQHTEVAPVEHYLPLLAPDPQRRAPALLEKQLRTSNAARERHEAQDDALRTEVTLVTERMHTRQRRFDQAIADRDLVGQAKGILMARWRVDADAADQMLGDAATRSRRSLPEVARSVVDRELANAPARHPATGVAGTGATGAASDA